MARKPTLHPSLKPFLAQVSTAEMALGDIRNGDHVFVGTGCAAPRGLVQALEQMRNPPADVELLHFFTVNAFDHDAAAAHKTIVLNNHGLRLRRLKHPS